MPSKKTPAKKSKKKPKTSDKKSKRRTESYSSYIYRVLKVVVDPPRGMSSKAMSIMNSFVNDIFERIATQASRVLRYNTRRTLSSREIQTATKLVLSGELTKHAVTQGTQAVTKYNNSNNPNNPNKKQKRATSHSAKAGLIFSVGRIHRHLKLGKYAARISAKAAVYLAAVIEYMVAEVLESAGVAAKTNRKTRITPRHITLAVRNDEEMDKFLIGVTIAAGGVLPVIHKALLRKKAPPSATDSADRPSGGSSGAGPSAPPPAPASAGRPSGGSSGAGSSGAGSSGPAPPASTRKVYIVDFDTKHCNPGNQMAAQGTIKEVDNTESNAKKWENKSNSLSNACDETQVKIGDADKNVMFEKLPSYFRRQVWYPAGDYAKGSELVKMNHNQFKKK